MENAHLDFTIETAGSATLGAGSFVSPSPTAAAATGRQREGEAQRGEASN